MILAPTTELEAVNTILASIGESPVNTVEDNGVVDAVIARQHLHNTSRRIQSRGWHWNTETGLTLTRTFPEGEIHLPNNTLRVHTTGADNDIDAVQRGKRLYNRRTHSYAFDRSLTVSLVLFLPFDELPEAARQYITSVAGRLFQEGQVGSHILERFVLRTELQALADLENAEAITANYNILPAHYGPGGALNR